MNKISGVYKITNSVTSEFYIGSSNDIKHRWGQHRSISTWVRKPGVKLYQAFIKYGLNNFTFEILEETADLKEREQYWIEQLQPIYNINRAKGLDEDGIRQYWKEYHEAHREEDNARMGKYNNSHRAKINNYYQRLCLYEGKILTLNVLKYKLSKLGFKHPVQEAKKYLLEQ